jgi:chaperonin GroEL (HSP60 family)
MSDDARADVTAAANTVCDIVRTTLGPFGANKLVIEGNGTVTTTSSGSVVLDRLDVSDPAVTLLQSAANGFRTAHGDGASSFVTLVGALLDEIERLSEFGLHPTTIERGYRDARDIAIDHINDRSRPLSLFSPDAVARTALTGTRDPYTRQTVSKYLAEVVETITTESPEDAFDPKSVNVVARLGGATSQTDLVRGVVLDTEPVVEGMPRALSNVGVALLSTTVDVPNLGSATSRTGRNVSLTAESFADRAAISERERAAFLESLTAAVDAGCGCIITNSAVNDRVKTVLANHGILALQRVDDEMTRIARATGARVVPGLDQVTPTVLGTADVRVRRLAGRDMTVVESNGNEPVYTLLCRAPDPRSVESFERSVESALAAVGLAARTKRVVPGGGAIEMSAAHVVQERARSIGGREQLAVSAFGAALTAVPRVLATTAGMDGASTIIRLRVAHSEGRDAFGIAALAGMTTNVLDDDPIVEPATLKRESWSAATDMAVKLARIDDRLPASDLSDESETDTESSV